MKFYNIKEDTRTSPYIIFIDLTLKEIRDREGLRKVIEFEDALESVIITGCAEFRRLKYPKDTVYFGSKIFMISCSNNDCHRETVEILNEFNKISEQIYNEVIKDKSISDKDKLEKELKSYFSYIALNYTLDSDLPKNDSNKKKIKI